MKLKLLLVNFLLLWISVGCYGASITRYPPITFSFFDYIFVASDQVWYQSHPRDPHFNEGELTAADDSLFGIYEMYVVYTGNEPAFGAVIKISPFGLNQNGITNTTTTVYAVQPTGNVAIVVNLTNIGTMPQLADRGYDSEGYITNRTHVASFTVEGVRVWLHVRYLGDPQHPVVMPTWGTDSGPGSCGKVRDVYDTPRLESTRPTQTTLKITRSPEGTEVIVRSLDENYVLEKSDSIPNWTNSWNVPIRIEGFNHIHRFPLDDGRAFFRAVR